MTALATRADSIVAIFGTERARTLWRSNLWMILMLVTVAASIGSSLSYTARADREINQQYEAKLALCRQQAERIRLAEQQKDQGMTLAAKAAIDASLVDAPPRSRALAEMFNSAPLGIRLVSLSIDQQADLDALSLVHLKGVVQTEAQLSQFVSRLAKSAWFGEVRLLPEGGNAPAAPRQFEITASFQTQRAPR
jgi:Tfp pilus assembly protein PilN